VLLSAAAVPHCAGGVLCCGVLCVPVVTVLQEESCVEHGCVGCLGPVSATQHAEGKLRLQDRNRRGAGNGI